MDRLRAQRQVEPATPAVVVVAIVLLALVVFGLGGGLPKLLHGDEDAHRSPVRLLTPAAPSGGPTDAQGNPSDPSVSPPSDPLPTASISVPIVTERPQADAIAKADRVAAEWARAFYTRDPGTETYEQLLSKVAPVMTAEVLDTYRSEGDATYDALRADGGQSTVASVQVGAPPQGSAPVDTPTRVTRAVTVTIDLTGKRPDRITLPQLVTLTPRRGDWVVSGVSGGEGP